MQAVGAGRRARELPGGSRGDVDGFGGMLSAQASVELGEEDG